MSVLSIMQWTYHPFNSLQFLSTIHSLIINTFHLLVKLLIGPSFNKSFVLLLSSLLSKTVLKKKQFDLEFASAFRSTLFTETLLRGTASFLQTIPGQERWHLLTRIIRLEFFLRHAFDVNGRCNWTCSFSLLLLKLQLTDLFKGHYLYMLRVTPMESKALIKLHH